MKVGDYVRTRYSISKCIRVVPIIENSFMYEFDKEIYEDVNYLTASELKKYKSSPNIMDLIEENDLITIEYYSLKHEKRVTRLFEVYYKDNTFMNLGNAKCKFMLVDGDFNYDDKQLIPIIKSIVTKEQFSQMEYKL